MTDSNTLYLVSPLLLELLLAMASSAASYREVVPLQ
jgi:hypothetical protein